LGADTSGNGNNWTPANFSVTAGVGNDSMVDTPTQYGTDTGAGGEVRGNYCTMNPLRSGSTLTNGNLNAAHSISNSLVSSTFGLTSGKWYWEATITNGSGEILIGVENGSASLVEYLGYNANGWGYDSNGSFYNNGGTATGTTFTTNDVIGVAVDMDAKKLWFSKNGTFLNSGSPTSGTNAIATNLSATIFPAFNPYDVVTSCAANFGQRAFAYTAPSGYKALCTTNLPTPTIGATAATQANKFFNPVTYTGNGTTTQQVAIGFQPDFVWHKCRSTGYAHYLQDSVRGANKPLRSASTQGETTETDAIMSFNTNGYIVGGNAATNYLNDTYVAWNWKASNATAVTNTDGSITSTVSANPTAGFSIVTYASTTGTVGHGLGVAPSVIIMKGRNVTDQWAVYHINQGNTSAIPLNTTGAGDVNSAFWNNTTPTSTVFSQGSWDSGYNKVAYCFAPVAGYSAFGRYTGTGSGDGPFVHMGFRPAFMLIKRTDTTNSWIIYDSARDTFNVAGKELLPDSSAAEASYTILDFLSNGIKIRTNAVSVNAFGGIYIYMAFASHPFKYSLAR
jgi:hypothetical protein